MQVRLEIRSSLHVDKQLCWECKLLLIFDNDYQHILHSNSVHLCSHCHYCPKLMGIISCKIHCGLDWWCYYDHLWFYDCGVGDSAHNVGEQRCYYILMDYRAEKSLKVKRIENVRVSQKETIRIRACINNSECWWIPEFESKVPIKSEKNRNDFHWGCRIKSIRRATWCG